MKMYRMRLPRRWSDEQCVAAARRSLARFGRFRPWVFLVYSVAMLVLGAGLVLVLFILPGPVGSNLTLAWFGFGLGIMPGTSVGMMGHQAVSGLALALYGLRYEELIVKYHDLARTVADHTPKQLDHEAWQQ
jgi:hypothetical protein